MGNSIEWESYLACGFDSLWTTQIACRSIEGVSNVTRRSLYLKREDQRAMDLKVRVEEGVNRELRDDYH